MSPDLREVLDVCRGAFYSAAGFSLLINFLMLLPAIYMLQLYDRVIPSGSESTLVMLTLIVVFLFVTLGALEWVRSVILVRVSTKIETLLNDRLYGIAFKQSLYSGGQRASSQPLDDLTALRQFLTGPGLFAFFDAPWIPIYIAVMFMFHAWIGWMAIVTAIILIILAVLNEKSTSGLLAEANGLALKNSAQVNKNLLNAEVIESMGMLANLRGRWRENAYKILAMQAEASSRAGLLTSMSKTIRISSQSLILGLGAYLAILHEISPGSMIAGSILLGRALAPIDQMIGTWKGFVSARLQYNRIDELLLNIPADEEKMSLPEPKGHLSVEAAFVTPPGAKVPAVKGANFVVPVGTAVGVIGPSGAGKSTLARALLGIWPAASGKIRLDGADVFAWDRMELGPHVGYLPQDVELFEGSISENVARFSDVDPEAVVQACKKADVHEMVLRLPEGYDTIIGPGGGTLSGGQRQRIGLARAMYGKPCVIVLDEPNSNLDDQGEVALAQALATLKTEQVTVIVITHRRNILNVVDNLLVMKDGQVVAYGEKNQVLQSLTAGQAQQTPAVSVPVIKPASA
ncbi:MAG: type I secretion system permease/ATPase [Cellvibrionales bacterium]|nr:MAG: type I secretion system permease/ATPase [Cellvibrionales bacterium]